MDSLVELVELEEDNEVVEWPNGMTGAEARGIIAAMHPRKVRKTQIAATGSCEPLRIDMAMSEEPKQPVLKKLRFDTGRIGREHRVFISGDILWCKVCGCWSTGRIRRDGLGGPTCVFKQSNATTLNRLMHGRHPETQIQLPRMRPLHY